MKYYGIYQAKVSDINDPNKRGRIKVICPTVLVGAESAWCDPVVNPVCKDLSGDFCIPSVGESVWIMYIEGDVNRPVYLGGWYSNNKTPIGNSYESVDKFRIIAYDGASILMKDGGVEIVPSNGNTGITVKSTGVEINGGMTINGSVRINGTLIVDGYIYSLRE